MNIYTTDYLADLKDNLDKNPEADIFKGLHKYMNTKTSVAIFKI
jgi:hypothetical protein